MKILLLKDVYKLGRAGDVKKVANGYGRNYLLPQGLAILATPGAIKQVGRIRAGADKQRIVLNKEMSAVAERMADVLLTFPAKASETGRLYGSINTRMLAKAISETIDAEISHRQIDSQPLRNIGEHRVGVRLTVDMIPEIKVIVYREGETPALALEEAAALAEAEAEEEVEEEVEETAEEGAEPAYYEIPEAVTEPEAEAEAEIETETEISQE